MHELKTPYAYNAKTRTILKRKYCGDAGVDIPMPETGWVNGLRKVPLGVKVSLPPGWFALIQERSSAGAAGLQSIGNVIDSGYDGELHATIVNHSGERFHWNRGDRIVQIVFMRGLPTDASLPERGARGFGSTGV